MHWCPARKITLLVQCSEVLLAWRPSGRGPIQGGGQWWVPSPDGEDGLLHDHCLVRDVISSFHFWDYNKIRCNFSLRTIFFLLFASTFKMVTNIL